MSQVQILSPRLILDPKDYELIRDLVKQVASLWYGRDSETLIPEDYLNILNQGIDLF